MHASSLRLQRAVLSRVRAAGVRSFAETTGHSLPRAVFVDGVRTPFLVSGTEFKNYIAQDLGRMAIKGLLTKTALPPDAPDAVVMGTVIQEGASGPCTGARARPAQLPLRDCGRVALLTAPRSSRAQCAPATLRVRARWQPASPSPCPRTP